MARRHLWHYNLKGKRAKTYIFGPRPCADANRRAATVTTPAKDRWRSVDVCAVAVAGDSESDDRGREWEGCS